MLTCWNKTCKENHLTNHCPKTTWAEYQKLREEFFSREKGKSQNQLKQIDSPKQPTIEESKAIGNAKAGDEDWTVVTSTRSKKKQLVLSALRRLPKHDKGTVPVTVEGIMETDLLCDSGADNAVVTRGLLDLLAMKGKKLEHIALDKPLELVDFQQHPFTVKNKVKFSEIACTTSAGKVMLRNAEFYIYAG